MEGIHRPLFCGGTTASTHSRFQIESAAVEIDGHREGLAIAIAACAVLDPLNLRVQPFRDRVGDAVIPPLVVVVRSGATLRAVTVGLG